MTRFFILLLATAFSITSGGDCLGKVLHVRADSTGDVATLNLAMYSAVAGDTILAAPGVYELSDCVIMKNGVRLISEVVGGAHLVPAPRANTLCAVTCGGISTYTEISGFWFDGFVYSDMSSGGGIVIDFCSELYIFDNIFTDNYRGIIVNHDWVCVRHNTFVGNQFSVYVHAGSGLIERNILWDPVVLGLMNVGCNDLLDIGDIETGWRAINFSADPMFCGADDFRVQPDSPCAPGNNPVDACNTFNELIGALPADCTVTPVQTTTWGQLKALLQKE